MRTPDLYQGNQEAGVHSLHRRSHHRGLQAQAPKTFQIAQSPDYPAIYCWYVLSHSGLKLDPRRRLACGWRGLCSQCGGALIGAPSYPILRHLGYAQHGHAHTGYSPNLSGARARRDTARGFFSLCPEPPEAPLPVRPLPKANSAALALEAQD